MGRPHLLCAPDKFRGTATSGDLAAAGVAAALAAGWSARAQPLADGGEGLLDALGATRRYDVVTGPLGEPVRAGWALIPASAPPASGPRTAVIEMAAASGIGLVGGARGNDAVRASTRGTGELVLRAIEAGAQRIVVGCGGSATTDGGQGAVDVIGGPGALAGVELVVASDVRTGFLDAARVFGPQKGASAAEVVELSERLVALAEHYLESFGIDVPVLEGAGAAGGLAGGLAAIGAKIVSGFDLVADLVGLDQQIAKADLVVTGEGCLDKTSLEGKVVRGVLGRSAGKARVLVIVGRTDGVSAADLAAAAGSYPGGVEVVSLSERFGAESAVGRPVELFGEVVAARVAALPMDARFGRG